MILAVAIGVVIGVALGSLGGGGSILAVPVLVYVAGQSAGAATSTSLVAVGVASLVAAIGHSRAGHIRWGAALAFVATGVAGSWAGSEVNSRLNGDVLLLAFSGLVLVAAYRMLTARLTAPAPTETAPTGTDLTAPCPTAPGPTAEANPGSGPGLSSQRVEQAPAGTVTSQILDQDQKTARPVGFSGGSVGRVVVAGIVVGFLTGMFGVGGGFVIVPALTLILGLSMRAAVGTSLVVIVGNAAVSLGFRGLDAVEWDVAVPFTIAMLTGSAVGSVIAHKLPQKRATQAFAVLLVAVAVGNGIAAAVALSSN